MAILNQINYDRYRNKKKQQQLKKKKKKTD